MPCRAGRKLDAVTGDVRGGARACRRGLCLSGDSGAPYITVNFFFLSGGTM